MSAEWPEYLLQDLCEFQNGFAFKNSEYVSGSAHTWEVFRMGYISRGGGFKEDSTPVFVPKEYAKKLDRYLLRKGDLTIAMTDMKNSMALLGHTARIPENERFVLNQRVGLIRVRKTEILDPLYLYYFSNSPDYIAYLRSRANSGVQVNLSTSAIKESVLKVPPLSVQKSIGETLGSLDDKIQLNHQINQTLEQMAQAIFKSWFVDFEPVKAKMAAKESWQALQAEGDAESLPDLETSMNLAAMQVISGQTEAALNQMADQQPEQFSELFKTAALFPAAMQDSELGEIPEGWEATPLSELFELHRGFDLPQKSREEGLYEVYAAGGLHGTHSQYKMEPPGIITGRSGVIGNVYLSLKKYWPLNTTLYVRQFRACGPYYAYHLLKTLDLKSLNSGSAVPSLNRNFVHCIAVLNPSSAILKKFESFSSAFFEQIVQNIDENELLSKLRDTLLPKLLSGELSVADLELEETADV